MIALETIPRHRPIMLDDDLRPSAAARQLCDHLLFRRRSDGGVVYGWPHLSDVRHSYAALPVPMIAWDPACGDGSLAFALALYFGEVLASDTSSNAAGGQGDWLEQDPWAPVDWVITQPHPGEAPAFLERAARLHEAKLIRHGWAFLAKLPPRDLGLLWCSFGAYPPSLICPLVETHTESCAPAWFVWAPRLSGLGLSRILPLSAGEGPVMGTA